MIDYTRYRVGVYVVVMLLCFAMLALLTGCKGLLGSKDKKDINGNFADVAEIQPLSVPPILAKSSYVMAAREMPKAALEADKDTFELAEQRSEKHMIRKKDKDRDKKFLVE